MIFYVQYNTGDCQKIFIEDFDVDNLEHTIHLFHVDPRVKRVLVEVK